MLPGNSSEQTVSLEMSPNGKDSLTDTNEMVVTFAARQVSQTYVIKNQSRSTFCNLKINVILIPTATVNSSFIHRVFFFQSPEIIDTCNLSQNAKNKIPILDERLSR